ncbi:hypothetical protein RHD99_20230 [Buttiauxella selenatireducens]|uniref:Ash family protein n=1 Tax=Buttiauxella selenatireducens TaxID=3073902 RepID=A0ABY9SHZ9_9ENTR|nr:hypothetical protein [Buttiauxella sp. R73]WMY76796.1 hypothetical protein RHD99_20230 [Buttiauxella sp. R73]
MGTLNTIPAAHGALASFLCRAFSYISMVGWAGASKDAPVSGMAGSSNPVQSTTTSLEPLVVVLDITYRRLPSWLLPQPKHIRPKTPHSHCLSMPTPISPY